MKKRFACLMLAIVLLISLIPTAAISAAAAAATATVSEAGIRVIKESVGFHKNAYQVGSQWKIGYGTPGTQGQTINEANADKLLRDELDKCVAQVNAKFGSMQLVQKQRDAAVWMTYTDGNGSADWANSLIAEMGKPERSASAMANAICTFDMAGFANDTAAYAVLARRLAIANLFLNGTYSASSSGNLGYTLFYVGNDSVPGNKYQIQVFSAVSNNAITVATPVWAGYEFLGWYSGTALVTGVSSATAGKVLSARWQQSGNTEPVAANYSLPAYVIYAARGLDEKAVLEVLNEPMAGAAKVDEITRDITVTVVAEKVVGLEKWIKLSTGGWVMLYDNPSKMPVTVPTTTVTITDDYVNIRKGADAKSAKVGTLKRGEQVTIAMTDSSGKWGYCSKGWIFLAYTTYKKSNSTVTNPTLTGGTPGTVTGAAKVNVRTAPGVSNPLATRLNEGTAITVYEQTTVDGAAWGHIDQGWISMGYVTLKQNTQPGGNVTTGGSAVVSSSVSLNVRSGPGAGYTKLTTLAPGTSVVILRKEVVNGVAWGLIDQGWINLNYVTTTASTSGSTGYGVGGTVVNCSTGVNIRSAAGTTNALVGVAALGSRVTVSERVIVNGFYWGHIDRGWVCMDYIKLDSEFVDPTPGSKDDNSELDNVVTSFQGYPAVIQGTTTFEDKTMTKDGTKLYANPSYHSEFILTLQQGTVVNITAFTAVDKVHVFGKVTIGDKTGWLNIDDVRMKAFNAKVTVATADAYEQPSTRSKFFASLVKGTYVTVGEDNTKFSENWALSDGVLWGRTFVNKTNPAWIKMADVTMFRENVKPVGITSLSGAGYMTGTLTGNAVVYEDNNGNVAWDETSDPATGSVTFSDKPSAYTLPQGSTVNVLARVYGSKSNATGTYAKVAVGSVVGWIRWDLVQLDHVTMKAGTTLNYYANATASALNAADGQLEAGNLVTIERRELVLYTNEINHGVIDMGYGYINDDRSPANYHWFILDDGKLVPTGEATTDNPGNPAIAASVVVTGTANAPGAVVYEEATTTSNPLLTISTGNYVTILNWRIVDGTVWGKVQVNKIVGWVEVNKAVSFAGLVGTVKVEQLKLYNMMDKTSSVQVLRVNNMGIAITNVTFDGTTLWGQVNIDGKNGFIDLTEVSLNTPKEQPLGAVIAKGKINSVNATANTYDKTGLPRDVIVLTKGVDVELYEISLTEQPGKAMWRAQLGEYVGWINMDFMKMGSTIATVVTPSVPIYNDLNLVEQDIMYTLYRDEKVTVINYKVNDVVDASNPYYGALFGEVVCGNSTGWILLCDKSNAMNVALTPGSTGTTIDPAAPSAPTTAPTTPSTAEATPAYIVCNTTVNVRSGAGVENAQVTSLPNGTNVKIYEETTASNGTQWVRIDQGWVCKDYIRLGTLTNVPNGGNNGNAGSVTIITNVPAGAIAVGYANQDIKVRTGSNMGYPEVATVKKNSSVVLYEIKLDGGMSWGRTDNGWVCVSYLTITGIGAAGSGTTGTVSGVAFTANVRGTSNSNGALMAKVMITSKVVVRETVTVGAETWVRTDLGWINGQYVTVASTGTPAPGTTTEPTTATEPTAPGSEFVG